MQLGLVGDSTLQETYLEDLKKSEPKEHSYKSIECQSVLGAFNSPAKSLLVKAKTEKGFRTILYERMTSIRTKWESE